MTPRPASQAKEKEETSKCEASVPDRSMPAMFVTLLEQMLSCECDIGSREANRARVYVNCLRRIPPGVQCHERMPRQVEHRAAFASPQTFVRTVETPQPESDWKTNPSDRDS
jgi:hypothetical protein